MNLGENLLPKLSKKRASPSGKASAFQADIRRFESDRPLKNVASVKYYESYELDT